MAKAYQRSFTDRMYSSIPVAYGDATDVDKNDLAVSGDQVGFYAENGPTTAEVADGATRDTMLITECQKAVFPKNTSTSFAVGEDVYYDDAHNEISSNAVYRPVGYAIKLAETSDTTIWIRFTQESAGGTY